MSVSEQLAILGGWPTIDGPLPAYRSMGTAELAAVQRVIESDCLSGFYGSPGDRFLGGPEVVEFESAWADHFGSRHVVSVNSATSGLIAAVGAAGVGPGDEVIVPPYTMSATVMAPLFYGGVPVFVDVDPVHFCLDVAGVRAAISPRTRAIIAVNLFGHPAELSELRRLADEHGLVLIEDAAQSPGATEYGRFCGTIGHIGVFSLNYHKHIHAGEGGMVVTDDDQLARRLQLIRNHGENTVTDWGVDDLTNLVGFNFRMTELSAAVGLEQLRSLDLHLARRVEAAEQLAVEVSGLEGITPPGVRGGCTHVYYGWVMRVDEHALGLDRGCFSAALAAEGVPHDVGYVEPLYLLPVFQRRIAIGSAGYPFSGSSVEYRRGMCPVVERLHDHEVMTFETCAYDLTPDLVSRIGSAVRKVHEGRHALRSAAHR